MAILVGSVEVDVVPNASKFPRQLRRQLVTVAREIGEQVGAQVGAGINDGIKGRIRDPFTDTERRARDSGGRAGRSFGGAFNDQVQSRVRAALASLPTPEIGVATTEADARLRALRDELDTLTGQTIGVDVDAGAAIAQLERIRDELAVVGAAHPDVQVRIDSAAARAQLADLLAQVKGLDGYDIDLDVDINTDDFRTEGARAGEQFGGTFNDAVQTRVRAALRDLPTPTISVATSEAEQALRDLRARLAELSDQRIGIDVDAADAQRTVAEIAARLTELASESPDVQVRVDAAAAAAELAAISREVDRLDRRDVDVNVNVGGSSVDDLNTYVGRLQAIALAGAALGPAIVPAAAAAVAGVGAIGPAAVAAGAGIGVLALAFSGIADAVTAGNAAQQSAAQDAKTSAAAIAAAATTVQSATASAAQAQANLGNAIANADSAAVRSAQAVVTARRAVSSAITAAALANRQSAQAYADAERAVAVAVRGSADAQRALTDARQTAQRQLEDLAQQQKDGALDERQAVLDVADAQDALNKARIDPAATKTSLDQAQLAYDRSKQQLEDIRTRNARVAADKAKADKAGVDGSDVVRSAQERLNDAVAAEGKARRDAADAATNITRTREAGAQRVAAAEQGVTTALRAQADQARQSAASIASANAAVESSARSLKTAEDALADAQTKQSTAQQKAATTLAGLSPAGAAFVGFVNGSLRPAVKRLQDAAQEGLLPGVQDGLAKLLPLMPGLTTFVKRLATAMGTLFDRASEALASPFWRNFFRTIAAAAPSLIGSFASVIGNLATAFAGLLQAFTPFSVAFGAGLARVTKRFAEFSTGLSTSAGFQTFLDYVRDNTPRVLALLGGLAGAIGGIIQAAAPLGPVVIDVLRVIVGLINAIPTPVLTVVLGLLAAYAVEIAAVKVSQGVAAAASFAYARGQLAVRAATLLCTAAGREQLIFNARVAASLLLLSARTVAVKVAQLASAAATAIVTGATQLWAIAQTEVNVAMLANPIGIVIIAIVALVAIIVIVVKHFGFFKRAAVAVFDFFRDKWPAVRGFITGAISTAVAFVTDKFRAVQRAAGAAIGYIRRNWKLLIAILAGPIGVAVFEIAKHWTSIRSGARRAVNYISGKFDGLVGFFTGLPARLGNAVKGLFEPLADSFKAVYNRIVGWWNGLSFTIGGATVFGQTLPSVTLSTPDIPALARGGVITAPTFAMIGEAGPEAVVPLSDSNLLANMLGKASVSAASAGAGPSREVNVTQNIYNPLPERASLTGPAALRKAALALGV